MWHKYLLVPIIDLYDNYVVIVQLYGYLNVYGPSFYVSIYHVRQMYTITY